MPADEHAPRPHRLPSHPSSAGQTAQMPQTWPAHPMAVQPTAMPMHRMPIQPMPVQQPVPPAPRPRRSAAAAAWMAGWSLLAPITVYLVGVLLYALKFTFAASLVVFTGGFIATDPRAERWIMDVMTWDAFDAWMVRVVPWSVASLFVTLAVGALVLVLLRVTGAATWRPGLQGLLAALGGFVLVVLGLGAALLLG